MTKKQKKINAVIHIPTEYSLQNLRQETNRLFAYTVRKYLDDSFFDTEEKKRIIKILISELK